MKIALLFLLPFTLVAFLPSQTSLRQRHLRSIYPCQRSLVSMVVRISSDRALTRMFESNEASDEGETVSDAAIMAKILAAADDNVFMRWSLEDDKLLLDGVNAGISLETLCITLKRGYQGVKARIKHLNNPKHKAFMRFYGTEAEEDKSPGSVFLRPCKDCIERIIWDPALDIKDFSFIYRDRFDGLYEKPCVAPNDNVKGKERMLIKAIPEHRIQSIKYKQRVVWDKEDRMDLIFGSAPGLTASRLEIESGAAVDSAELVSEVEYSTDYAEQSVGSGLEVEDRAGDSWSASNGPIEDGDDSSQAAGGYSEDSYDYSAVWDDDDDDAMENNRSSRNLKIEDVIATYESWLASKQEKEIEEEAKAFVIFCDLDGVLCDFEAGVQKIFKKKKTAEISPKVLWPRLATTPDFYALLPWMEGGLLLWRSIERHTPTIITGCPRGGWAEKQKREWSARELGAGVPVITCMSKDKYKHCTPSAILIDDRDATRDSWESAGGVFVLHENVANTLQQLRDLGVRIAPSPIPSDLEEWGTMMD